MICTHSLLHTRHGMYTFLPSIVGLYSESAKGAVVLIEEVGGGVTHMLFSQDGNLLYTGYRKVAILMLK